MANSWFEINFWDKTSPVFLVVTIADIYALTSLNKIKNWDFDQMKNYLKQYKPFKNVNENRKQWIERENCTAQCNEVVWSVNNED